MGEFLKQYLTGEQNGYLQSGRLREVVVGREVTVFDVRPPMCTVWKFHLITRITGFLDQKGMIVNLITSPCLALA